MHLVVDQVVLEDQLDLVLVVGDEVLELDRVEVEEDGGVC